MKELVVLTYLPQNFKQKMHRVIVYILTHWHTT